MRKVNRFKKVVAAVLVLTMAVAVFPLGTNAEPFFVENHIFAVPQARSADFTADSEIVAELGYAFALNYARAMQNREMLSSVYQVDEQTGELTFPAYYGGAYIDEWGNLNFLVVGSAAAAMTRTEMQTISQFNRNAGVVVRVVAFSYAELRAAGDKLTNLVFRYRDTIPALQNLAEWGVDVIQNHVFIYLVEYHEFFVEEFRKTVMDSPMLAFGKSMGCLDENIENKDIAIDYNMFIEKEFYHNYQNEIMSQNPIQIFSGGGIRIGPENAVRRPTGREHTSSIGYFARIGQRDGFIITGHEVRATAGGTERVRPGFTVWCNCCPYGGCSQYRLLGIVRYVQMGQEGYRDNPPIADVLQGIDAAFVEITNSRVVVNPHHTWSSAPGSRVLPGAIVRTRGATMAQNGFPNGRLARIHQTGIWRHSIALDRFFHETVLLPLQGHPGGELVFPGDSGGLVTLADTGWVADVVGINNARRQYYPYDVRVSSEFHINLRFNTTVWGGGT